MKRLAPFALGLLALLTLPPHDAASAPGNASGGRPAAYESSDPGTCSRMVAPANLLTPLSKLGVAPQGGVARAKTQMPPDCFSWCQRFGRPCYSTGGICGFNEDLGRCGCIYP
jgi:hypothetical protein